MSKVSQEEWTSIVSDYVAQLAELSHGTYLKLHPSPEGNIQVPTQAEPFCGMVADGIIGMFMVLRSLNGDVDSVQIFLEELSMRLASLGYMIVVDADSDPEIHKRACAVVEEAMKPPEGTLKH